MQPARNWRSQLGWLPLLGALAIFGLSGCDRPLSQAELERHFSEDSSPHWLFAPGGHINFDANTAGIIRRWLATHSSDWRPASLSDFDPVKTQLLTDSSAVEIDGARIVVTFERNKKDDDSTVYIQRLLSPSDRAFWDGIIEQIRLHGVYERRRR